MDVSSDTGKHFCTEFSTGKGKLQTFWLSSISSSVTGSSKTRSSTSSGAAVNPNTGLSSETAQKEEPSKSQTRNSSLRPATASITTRAQLLPPLLASEEEEEEEDDDDDDGDDDIQKGEVPKLRESVVFNRGKNHAVSTSVDALERQALHNAAA